MWQSWDVKLKNFELGNQVAIEVLCSYSPSHIQLPVASSPPRIDPVSCPAIQMPSHLISGYRMQQRYIDDAKV